MKAREDAGYVVTKVEEDPAILYEQHRKASCMRARHILERYDSPDPAAVGILHGIVGEVNAHDPENDIAAYLTYPSDKAVQLAGDGLTAADIAEKRKMGGWNPQTDPLMLINEQGDWTGVTQQQGDWTGVTQQQADQIVWDNREEILERASDDNELSTWTLSRLDQLKEHEPDHALDRDQPEPEHQRPHGSNPRPGATDWDCSPTPTAGGGARLRTPPLTLCKRQEERMTTEEHPTMEPVIWFEGTLIRDPQPHGGQYDWLLETLADADGDAPKITIRARGAEHSANIRDNAHKIPPHGQRRRGRRRIRHRHRGHEPRVRPQPRRAGREAMTRTTVSGIRPDKTGTGEWIDINSHVGRLMSTLMADGRPFSIDATRPA